MKKALYILFLSFFLFSCSEKEIITDEVKKQDFYVDIKNINDFGKELSLEKTGKLSSSQDIKLSSQALGRVSKIYVKEGEYVKQGDIIARLEDNIADYGLSLEKTLNSLEKAKINYKQTENQLNKQISDLKINLDNLKIDETNSKSSLELGKIENSIKKLVIDYENLKITNLSSISGFKNSMGKDLTSFITFTDNIIDFSDRLLGVTYKNEDINDSFENYLGAKDTNQKRKTEELLKGLIKYKKTELINTTFNFEGIGGFDGNIKVVDTGYSKILLLLNSLDITLDNSIPSIGLFTDSEITAYKNNVNTYLSSFNVKNGTFITFKNSINSFLDTYTNNEDSVLKQIELLVSDRNIYVKGLDIKLEIDESSLVEAISNKSLTLRQLDTVIVDARIAYKQALNNINKLGIKSPINGTIGKIFIDIGQEVSKGTMLFNISNNSSNEVVISFSENELENIKSGDNAYISFNNKILTGSIYSISNTADSNLNYMAKISFKEGMNLIGNIVKINIPFNINNVVLPINIVKIDELGNGLINIYKNGMIEQKKLQIGNIYSDNVEILGKIDPNLSIIVTDIDNFDKSKFELKIK